MLALVPEAFRYSRGCDAISCAFPRPIFKTQMGARLCDASTAKALFLSMNTLSTQRCLPAAPAPVLMFRARARATSVRGKPALEWKP